MARSSAVRDPRAAAWLVLLVTAAVFINYIDRGNLPTAAKLITDELHLSATQLGILFGAFYPSYVLVMPVTGWLADRYGAKRVLAAGITVWSLATLLTGFAGGFVSLLALRLMLGIGESVTFPCASKVLANAVGVARLGVANGVLSFGYLVGPAVGTFFGGWLMAHYGWRPLFVVFGALSLLWLWPWSRAKVEEPANAEPARTGDGGAQSPPLALILRQRALWGAAAGHFASNYTYYFILNWLPFYLMSARGFSAQSMSWIASSAFLVNALSALGMGWLQDHWIRAGRSTTLVYKVVMGLSHAVTMACMAGIVLLPERGSIVSLFVFCIIAGFSYPGIFSIPQIMAGPSEAGRWVGFQNACGNVAGIIALPITGWLIDFSGGRYELAFACAALINVVGFIGWVFVPPAIRPIDWAIAALGTSHDRPATA